ncbi:MAG: ROK family protein [Clostridia bacterium]|nr:ROK family protein [Clostridia bacterium]
MYRIGIDLGGTNIAVGLVTEDKKIIKKVSVPTGADRNPELIIDDMAAACRTLIAEAGVDICEIAAVGIASPGIANHDDGVVEYANNLPFRKLPICAMLRERFPVENIRVENDANAAAWGEAVAGAARGTRSSVMITLGTGVGGGIIIDGKVQSGFNYAGGELGHIVICAGGRPCSCGRRGCWEAYSSATALIDMTREKIEECRAAGRHTVMEDLAEKKGKISARTAYDGMRLGDKDAADVVDKYVELLGVGLANIVNIFQPEVISIGGGVSNEKDALLKPLLPIVRKEQYGGGIVPETEIRIAELGNDAGIIGAAFLGL